LGLDDLQEPPARDHGLAAVAARAVDQGRQGDFLPLIRPRALTRRDELAKVRT